MKTLLVAGLLLLSFSSQARDLSCSPYPTETADLIDNARSCEEGAKIALKCKDGSRNDGMLAYTALKLCEELFGGEAALTPAQNKKLKAGYHTCSKKNGENHGASLFCMLEVIRKVSADVVGK